MRCRLQFCESTAQFRKVSALDIPRTIGSLQQRFETVRRSEITRMRRRLGQLSQDQESAIDSLARDIINKILDGPMAILNVASTENDAVVLKEAVHRIFNLSDVPQGHAGDDPDLNKA
jgi:glutamyl-tRNA reductase